MIDYDWLYDNAELKGFLHQTFKRLANRRNRITAPRMVDIRKGLEKTLQDAGKAGQKFLRIPYRQPGGRYDQSVYFNLCKMEEDGTIQYLELKTERGVRKVYCLTG